MNCSTCALTVRSFAFAPSSAVAPFPVFLWLCHYLGIVITTATITWGARRSIPSVLRVSTLSSVLWIHLTPAHTLCHFVYTYRQESAKMRRSHGVICAPSCQHALCLHALCPHMPPQSWYMCIGFPHFSAGSSLTERHCALIDSGLLTRVCLLPTSKVPLY